MENLLERIYFEWCEEMRDSAEVEKLQRKLNEYDDVLKQALSGRKYIEFDDLVHVFACEYQKQGFMAGFEIAKQLLMGGYKG